jgi:hypothetical protein
MGKMARSGSSPACVEIKTIFSFSSDMLGSPFLN